MANAEYNGDIIEKMLGRHRLLNAVAGGNSPVDIVQVGSCVYAVKRFMPSVATSTIRYHREKTSLQLLGSLGSSYSPKLIQSCDEELTVVMEYIRGSKVSRLRRSDISSIADFAFCANRNELEDSFGQEVLNASECFVSTSDIRVQLRDRVDSLGCMHRIDDSFMKVVEDECNAQEEGLKAKELPESLDTCYQYLSQSDVGFHNSIRVTSGVRFFDFEHSGWDDPAKQVCDWICRPNSNLSMQEIERMIGAFAERDQSGYFRERLSGYMPIISLKWFLIQASRIMRGLDPGRSLQQAWFDYSVRKEEVIRNSRALKLIT